MIITDSFRESAPFAGGCLRGVLAAGEFVQGFTIFPLALTGCQPPLSFDREAIGVVPENFSPVDNFFAILWRRNASSTSLDKTCLFHDA
jgi:hypothetical protein